MPDEYQREITEQFELLPEVVQRAILSADVEKQLRSLSETHQLHLDQWKALQDEVMLALLGLKPVEELASNLREKIVLSSDAANVLAADISKTIFEPIRQELERELGNPEAKAEITSDLERVREEVLSAAPVPTPMQQTASQAPSAIQPATPPAPPPSEKAARGPASGAYKPGETSTARKEVHDDPYREPPA